MDKKIIWVLAILVIIILGGAFFLFGGNAGPSTNTGINDAPLPVPDQTVASTSDTSAAASVSNGPEKDFTVIGTSFAFNPSKIEVNQGDKVKILFKDNDGFHDLKIEGYNVATERINSGQEQTITFTADKTGTFAYYCSVGSHREKGMKGTLIVK